MERRPVWEEGRFSTAVLPGEAALLTLHAMPLLPHTTAPRPPLLPAPGMGTGWREDPTISPQARLSLSPDTSCQVWKKLYDFRAPSQVLSPGV